MERTYKLTAWILAGYILALGSLPGQAASPAAAPPGSGDASGPAPPLVQFYERILGEWVGTATTRVEGQEPATEYFHLAITREDAHTFREEYTFFRRGARTSVLEPSGTQTSRATLEPDGSVRCVASGKGTLLMDSRPKNKSWQAAGAGSFPGSDRFLAEISGTISVDGMPFGAGRGGRIRSGRSSWQIEGSALVGKTDLVARFRALVFSKRVRVSTMSRAERGKDVHAFAAGQK